MKKRMFITTIVMMLVLAVALTTSSLAWFSSANKTVTVNSATFTASSAGSDNVNLKISDDGTGWGNQINLATNTSRSLVPLIPTAPLISAAEVGDDIVTTGVDRKGSSGANVHTAVTHKGYVWPARISFNTARINASDSKFVIEATGTNKVTNYAGLAVDSYAGYYYDEFYLLNADQQNSLSSLTFKVSATIGNIASGKDGYQKDDYTATGYVAFIIFDLVNIAADKTIPANALENAGKRVVAYNTEPEAIGENDIKEGSKIVDNATVGTGVDVWIPFAAFTFCTAKGNTDTFGNADWQFADLDANDGQGHFTYDGALTTSLNTQHYDALTGIGNNDGFVLNQTNLRALNNKVVGNDGNVGSAVRESSDNASVFVMQPTEIWRVAMYYWLDGRTLTEYTDTTVSTIGVTISAAQ